ncbi:MAG: thioredoxin domain-containing protein, partial [Bacteroidota bacterium]
HAIACFNGLRLGGLAGEPEWEASTHRALASDARLRAHPSGHTAHLLAAQIALGPAVEIVIAPGEGEDTLREALREVYAPGAVLLRATPEVTALVPFTATQTARDGLATAYICENGACQAPTTDPTEAARTLAETVSGTRP